MKVHEALSKVMADVGAVKKGDRNSQSGYNFRGIDAVTSAVYPALVKHGVVVVPKVTDYQYGTVVVGHKRTEMSHVRLTVQFTWIGPEGDSIEGIAAGEAFDSGDKATAKAHSVAFRTALLQTLCLPTDDPDPDTHTYERSGADPAEEARNALLAKCEKEWGVDPREIAKRFRDECGYPINNADRDAVQAFTDQLEKEFGGPE